MAVVVAVVSAEFKIACTIKTKYYIDLDFRSDRTHRETHWSSSAYRITQLDTEKTISYQLAPYQWVINTKLDDCIFYEHIEH